MIIRNNRLQRTLFSCTGMLFCILSLPCLSDILEPKDYYSRIARDVAFRLPRMHLSQEKLNDEISKKALDIYLSLLDFDHSFFLASDISLFKEKELILDDLLKEGEIEYAYNIFEIFKERVRDRVAYVNELLDKGFDIQKTEYYTWERKEAPWPVDKKEWDDLWRKKIKNLYVGSKVTKELNVIEEEENPKEVEDEDTEQLILTPEDHIRKRYKHILSLVEGHDAEWVLGTYIKAFTRSYDAHSDYHTQRECEDFDIQMSLSLIGIGAELTTDEGAAKIVRLIPAGPAVKDGRLKPGDKIIAVGQEDEEAVDILYWPLYKAVRLIRGKMGTKVVLSVIPASDKSGTRIHKIDLVRDKIKLENRAAKSEFREISFGDKSNTRCFGIITLPSFYNAEMGSRKKGKKNLRVSSMDVKNLLKEFKEENVDGVVLDLRYNGGGSLEDAIKIAGLFIKKGPIVQAKANRRVNVFNDLDKNVVYDGPLAVLVNRQSASASEIVAAALQDYNRAIIVGDTRTHGKGTVQSLYSLNTLNPRDYTLGKLKLTTAGFFRVDGRSTQLKGVEPDIIISSALDVMEIGEVYLDNVLPWSQVSSARYKPVNTLSGMLPQLEEKSWARLQNDPEYTLRKKLLDRIQQRNEIKKFPLNFDERMQLAKKDRELDKLQKENFGFSEDEDNDEENKALSEDAHPDLKGNTKDFEKKQSVDKATVTEKSKEKNIPKKVKKDYVLTETLNILWDFIESHEDKVASIP